MEQFMRQAIAIAEQGLPFVSPNPAVGALLIKNNKLLVCAWHEKFGGPHAEALLFEKIHKKNISMRSATLVLTLEPCISFEGKKTPSCVAHILASGIEKVYIAMLDPNPFISGKGVEALRKKGREVHLGLLEKEAQKLNEHFSVWKKIGRPFIGMKVAASLDGKIATRTGHSRWITGKESLAYVHETLRDQYDAILVGSKTVLADNPLLAGNKRQPLRVILDSKLTTSPRARVFRDKNVLVVTTKNALASRRTLFQKKAIPLHIFPKKIDLPKLLKLLATKNISSLLVEGGATVFGSFIDANLVDRLHWFTAPYIIGGKKSLSAVGGRGVGSLKAALNWNIESVKNYGRDLYFEATPRRSPQADTDE